MYGYVPVFRAICVRGVRTLNYAIIPISAQSNVGIILRAMPQSCMFEVPYNEGTNHAWKVAQQKKRVKSIIDFMTDFKSIVKSTHDLTGKSCAFDLRLILLSNQL